MDKRIRVLAVVFLLCFGVLFLQLNNFQVRQASELQHSPDEPQTKVSTWLQPRGDIIASNGKVLAYSTKNPSGSGYIRHYTQGPLYADVTGYYDWAQESDQYGIESEYNGYLVQHEPAVHSLSNLLTQTKGTDTVETTIFPKVQQVAEEALAPYEAGAVVAIVPTTGAVVAMYSKPSYNPNKLSGTDGGAITKYADSIEKNAENPEWPALANGVTYNLTAPGSTFKVITTSAILDEKPALANKYIKVEPALTLPETTNQLHNFDGEDCGGSLAENLWQSCDTAYGQYGLDLGPRDLAKEAKAFGLNSRPPIDLPAEEVSRSGFPSIDYLQQNLPQIAYSAIGQGNVTETVLQDALVASAMADGGTMMTPHLMAHVIDDQGRVVATYKPHAWLHVTSIATADQVRQLMLGVAKTGTAEGVFPADLDVAAKTGTAEVGANDCSSDWLIATAPAGSGQVPKIAVAAVVPYQAGVTACDGTGAEVAGPVVAKVLEAAISAGA